jgi:organic hydroperoxide reductase OsmC/OhrA
MLGIPTRAERESVETPSESGTKAIVLRLLVEVVEDEKEDFVRYVRHCDLICTYSPGSLP